MNLIERFKSENPQANLIWRFYSDSAHQWKWEHLAFNGTVLERSECGYPQYESCLANACERGYVFWPSLSSKRESTSPKTKRSYIRLNLQRKNGSTFPADR